MLTHMKEQKDRGVGFGRIFLVCFSRGDDKKWIKKIHRWRANSRAVCRAHEERTNPQSAYAREENLNSKMAPRTPQKHL